MKVNHADSIDSIPHDIRVIRANTLFDGIHGATNADWIVPGYTPSLIWRASDTVKQRISNAGTLNRPVNIEEVVTAIEKTNRRAAPGVDGIPAQCVKEAWKGDDKEDPMLGFTVPLVAAGHLAPSSCWTPGPTHSNPVVLYYLCAYACNTLCLWSIPCLESVRAR